MSGETLSRLLSIGVFGLGGLFLARLFKVPASFRTRLLLGLAAIVGSYVGVKTFIVSIFGVGIVLNWALSSCCLGLLVGLLIRGLAATRAAKRPA
jgi:hypothetical protein